MHLSRVVLLALSAVLSSALILPETRSDGVFRVYTGADGKEVHERITDLPSTGTAPLSPRDDSQIHARSIPTKIWCGCGFTLDHANCDIAVENLKRHFVNPNTYLAPGTSVYAIQGSVVAFACNKYANTRMLESPYSIGNAMSDITKACGRYIAGTVAYDYSDQIGYMRWKSGLNVCANAATSSRSKC